MNGMKPRIIRTFRALFRRLFGRPSMRDTVVLRRAWEPDATVVSASTMVIIEVYADGQSRLIALPARPSFLHST